MKKWRITKLCRITKILLLVMLVGLTHLSANVKSQNQQITLTLKNVTVEQAVNEAELLLKQNFFFSKNEVDVNRKINVNLSKASLKELIRQVFGASFSYRMEGDIIVVQPKKVMDEQQKENITIQGKVIDKQKLPLPGVTVVIKGSKLGTATDMDGQFKLVSPKQDSVVLVFSFVGMMKKEVHIVNDKPLVVTLEEEVNEMNEVVVTGYQTVKKRSMAGSSSNVKAEDLVINGTQTLEQALQGKLSGVMVMNQSGLTGTRQKVRVRGTSTLVGNAEPVWVVDGIIQEDPLPFQASQLTDIGGDNMDMIKNFVGGAISWLNPNDIDNIVVLKDASSTAIYGVKAANGVIVITTKKGERGRVSIGYSGNFSISNRLNYKKMELMNSMQRVDASREAFDKGGILQGEDQVGYMALALAYQRREISFEEFNTRVKKLETGNTDWFDILFQTPFSHNHNLSISGGNEKSTYRASFGMNNQNNTAKGNGQKSYTGSLNISSMFWDQVSISLGLSGNISKTEAFIGIDPYTYASTTNRAIPCFDEEGELYFYKNEKGLYNVLNELNNSGNKNTTSSVNSNLNVRWSVGGGFTLSSILGYNISFSSGESWYSEKSNHITQIRGYEFGAYWPGDARFIGSRLPYGGELNMNEARNDNYTWRNQLEFTKTLGTHAVSGMIGQEVRSNKYDGYAQTDYGYMPDRGKSFAPVPIVYGANKIANTLARSTPTITDRKANYLSYYGNMSYMYDERYALNASIRMDASNRFGQNKSTRYQPVWSVGARWNVTREHWLEEQDLLNDLSLRASYGFQGNVAENVGPNLVARIDPVNTTGEYTMSIASLPTPNLKWEKNKSINVGIDFSIFKNKINGSFEYYHKRTEDMLTTREVPLENGVVTMIINGGNMKNSGWDLSFSLVPVRTKDFVWTLGMNTSKVYNSVDSDLAPTGKWQDAVTGDFNKKDYPVSSFWAFRFTGLNPENGGPLFDFSQANTQSAELDVTQYMKYAGKLEPDFTAGLNTSFRYKTLSLSANFYLSTGNKMFLSSPYGGDVRGSATKIPYEYYNMSTQLLDRWRKPGDEAFTSIPALPHPGNSGALNPFYNFTTTIYPYDAWSNSDARVVNSSYLRCNNIMLSYTLPQNRISRFAQNISCSISVSNPFQIVSKDFHGRDPEVASGKQPLSKNYSLSVNMNF